MVPKLLGTRDQLQRLHRRQSSGELPVPTMDGGRSFTCSPTVDRAAGGGGEGRQEAELRRASLTVQFPTGRTPLRTWGPRSIPSVFTGRAQWPNSLQM